MEIKDSEQCDCTKVQNHALKIFHADKVYNGTVYDEVEIDQRMDCLIYSWQQVFGRAIVQHQTLLKVQQCYMHTLLY